MDFLITDCKKSKTRQIFQAIIGLYFVVYCGYFILSSAKVAEYGTIFLFSCIGFFIGLILFVSNTIWASNKALLKIGDKKIESNIRGCKFKIDWVKVSNASISPASISFHIDGGKKIKTLDLSNIHLKDVAPLKEKVAELCRHKNIVCPDESK